MKSRYQKNEEANEEQKKWKYNVTYIQKLYIHKYNNNNNNNTSLKQ